MENNQENPVELLRTYLQETPAEELKKDWDEVQALGLDENGPRLEDVIPQEPRKIISVGTIGHIGMGRTTMMMLAASLMLATHETEEEMIDRHERERQRLREYDVVIVSPHRDSFNNDYIRERFDHQHLTSIIISPEKHDELFPRQLGLTAEQIMGHPKVVFPIELMKREFDIPDTSYFNKVEQVRDRERKQRQKAQTWGKKSNRKGGWLS